MTNRVLILVSYVFSVAGFIMLSSCTVGPNYERPQTIADIAERYVYTTGKHLQDINDSNEGVQWWERFGDPTTTELVQHALNNNYDIHAAAARVLQAQALLAEIRGQQLPDVSYNLGGSRGKTSYKISDTRFSILSTTYSQDISINYIVDLFGKLRRQQHAAWADLLAAEASKQAVVNAVISAVVKARADIATKQRALALARANTANWQKNLKIIERRYSSGLLGPLDVRLARENLEASKATEIVTELALAKAQNALDVLVSRHPGSGKQLPETLPDLPDLTAVPVGVPALLLDRRPDVMAAELALKASNEQVGISIAQLYPDLTLTGSYGFTADTFKSIFNNDTEIYSAIIRLAQPIFKGGQLRARIDATKARYEELAADYAKTVLTAVREVEDALVREQLLQQRLKALQFRLNEAVAAEKLARERYLRGIERLIIVLETERRRRIAENALNNIKGELWTGRVDLFLALGGDWAVDS